MLNLGQPLISQLYITKPWQLNYLSLYRFLPVALGLHERFFGS